MDVHKTGLVYTLYLEFNRGLPASIVPGAFDDILQNVLPHTLQEAKHGADRCTSLAGKTYCLLRCSWTAKL